jgi:hypothetical protein
LSGFNGSGTYVRAFNWVNDAAAAINITASRVDSDMSDVVNGFNLCVTRDSQGKISTTWDFNNFGGKNLISGSAGTPSLSWNASTNTGFYLPAAGQIGFSGSGVELGQLDATAGWTSTGTATSTSAFLASGTFNGGATVRTFENSSTIGSSVITLYNAFHAAPSTAASAFTLANGALFSAGWTTTGAGSAVTNLAGFTALSTLGAVGTLNIGFRGQIAAASGNWNIYMDGTAINYLAGNLLVGTTTDSGSGFPLQAVGNANSSVWVQVKNSSAGGSASAGVQINTGTANSNFLLQLNDGAGSPSAYLITGSAVGSLNYRSAAHQIQNGNGATTFARVNITSNVFDYNIDAGGTFYELGLRDLPFNTQASTYTLLVTDRGKVINETGHAAITVPNSVFSVGNVVTILNNSTTPMTITQGAGMSMIWCGNGGTGNRTLGNSGICTLVFTGASQCYISGTGLS